MTVLKVRGRLADVRLHTHAPRFQLAENIQLCHMYQVTAGVCVRCVPVQLSAMRTLVLNKRARDFIMHYTSKKLGIDSVLLIGFQACLVGVLRNVPLHCEDVLLLR